MAKVGRKPLTPQQKAAKREWDNTRTKITHLVDRKDIDRKCVVCGKKGEICHNKENPYLITFLCRDCRKVDDNVIKAEETRFDIREQLDRQGTHILKTTTPEFITRIIVDYMNDTVPIREYCKKKGISEHQFSKLKEQYATLYPSQPIEEMMISHRNKVHKHRIKISKQV